MSELRGGGLECVKVLRKEWFVSAAAPDDTGCSDVAYIAFSGSLVIGVYGSKHEVWETCRRNWERMSYWTDMKVDEKGMDHREGRILRRMRHWFVAPFTIDFDLTSVVDFDF